MPLTKEIVTQTLSTLQGERAYKIIETLFDAGYDAWWVGGAVRDMLLGRIPVDIDIGTNAIPQEITTLFTRSNAAPSVFGSVRILLGDRQLEVTTFREDDEASDGRHPESVVFGDREQDAKRRDFSVNAIYWHPITGEMYDPFHGEEDLKERLVRFIGDPAVRIKHDALRMLRAVRLRAKMEGQYHPETYRALQEQAQLVEILSGRRQLEETEKMLKCEHPARAFEDLWELGILQHFLPELHACKGIPQPADYHHEGDVWEHMMRCIASLRHDDHPDVRLAILFHDSGKAKTFSLEKRIRFDEHATVSAALAAGALRRLQCAKKRIEKIEWLIKHHMMMSTFLEIGEERKAHWYFHPWFLELLRVFELDIAGTEPSDYDFYNRILKDYHAFLDRHPRPAKALLTGDDVMDIMGIRPGAQVGEILLALHDAQVRGEITSKKEALSFIRGIKKT
ncbi:MAG: CCA tRNA nucleotidyltransferase [Candidatus Peribacteraceae bacterium]|nr:CCA tRNA nucleotidyltransferase [Candidatus Peribacteraceae bacterium]